MSTAVIVNGAFGKMGTLACQTLDQHPEFKVVAALGSQDDLGASIEKTNAQLVIDLTRADCVFANAMTIVDHAVSPVIGTSGLTTDQIQILTQRCQEKQLGGIIVPNFSMGAVLMMHFAAIAARFLSEVEIIETHHQQKLDAPSGTAFKTAELIAQHRSLPKNKLENKHALPGARGAMHQDIPIHSLRLPGFLAKQEVIFGNLGESLTISHVTQDRQAFMPGLILACQGVQKLKSLYYGLDQLLDL